MKEKLEGLGLQVTEIRENVFSCRTPKEHLVLVYYSPASQNVFNEDLWQIEVYNSNCCNFYDNEDAVIEVLTHYITD